MSYREYLERERAQRTIVWLDMVRIAQANKAASRFNPATTAAAANAVHDWRSLSKSFASRDQTYPAKSNACNQDNQSLSHSSNTQINNPQIRVVVNILRYRHHELTRVHLNVLPIMTPRRTRAKPT